MSEISPDALILDLTMPRHDGLEVLHRLQSRERDIPALLLTARVPQDPLVQQSLALPRVTYLAKPFRVEHVTQTLWNLLR